MPVSADEYKALCANWASGVTIVTSRDGDRIQGMTASAFTEVSLDPPLVLFCADKATITNELIQASGVFSVSILAQGQDALSNKFASKNDEHRRFEGLECVAILFHGRVQVSLKPGHATESTVATGNPHLRFAVGRSELREALVRGDRLLERRR